MFQWAAEGLKKNHLSMALGWVGRNCWLCKASFAFLYNCAPFPTLVFLLWSRVKRSRVTWMVTISAALSNTIDLPKRRNWGRRGWARVTFCIRAVWGCCEVNSKVFWVSWVVSPCFFLSTALHPISLFPMGLQLEKQFLFIILPPEAQVVPEPHFILIGTWGDLHNFLN